MRILYISFLPPTPTWGGAMAFYRHFIERTDFELKVVTNRERLLEETIPYKPVLFNNSNLTRRLFRTRLIPWLYGPYLLTAQGRVPKAVWQATIDFQPDAVFTIAGSWDWSALVAQQVARKLKVPLIASFNDWFNYGWFPAHPIYHRLIERRFRRFYREADLALCTCEGMQDALGPHSNAHILYPTGALLPEGLEPFKPYLNKTRPFIIAFAGSMADWYGPMLEQMVVEAESQKAPLEFRFYGSNPTWSREFDAHAKMNGIYRGQLPFEQLRQEIAQADGLILPMGFEERAALVERTSFKTKFLDYLAYQKPILVWGPEYCSAVRVAREFDSAEICIELSATAILARVLRLKDSPQRQSDLVRNARVMYESRFHPDIIHGGLVAKIHQTIEVFQN